MMEVKDGQKASEFLLQLHVWPSTMNDTYIGCRQDCSEIRNHCFRPTRLINKVYALKFPFHKAKIHSQFLFDTFFLGTHSRHLFILLKSNGLNSDGFIENIHPT